jgi:hypothetical protein
MIDSFVDVRVKLASFRQLVHRVALLPAPFRPTYFTVGERVRDKDSSRVDDQTRFSAFVDEHVDRVSGFDLIGERIRFGFLVGETRNARNESTHVGCSVVLRGQQWQPADLSELLRQLCFTAGVERADACRRDEWRYRHSYVKKLPQFTIERALGVDMSAYLPGLYWWTVFSDELAARHDLDVAKLAAFSGQSARWPGEDNTSLNAFRLYDCPDDWTREKGRVSGFLEAHPNFFSITRIAAQLEAAESKQQFDEVTRPYWAGAVPWESVPKHRDR